MPNGLSETMIREMVNGRRMTMDDLPPLPEPRSKFGYEFDPETLPTIVIWYTADQMRDFAAAAVAQERESNAALCDRFAKLGMNSIQCAAAIRKGA